MPSCLLILFCTALLTDSPAEERLLIKIRPLEKKTVQPLINAFGILEKDPQVLYFETAGYLTKLLANEGETIEKGDLLAKLDTTIIDNEKAQVRQALAYDKKISKSKKIETQQSVTPRFIGGPRK